MGLGFIHMNEASY